MSVSSTPSLSDNLPSTSRYNMPSTSQYNAPSTSQYNLPSTSQSIVTTISQNNLAVSLPQSLSGIAPTEINYRTLTLELDNVCRVCLFQNENICMFVNILENEDLVNDVLAYYKVQVQPSDSRSKMICRTCIHHIDEWHQRTKTAINAQLIQDFLTVKAIEKASKSGTQNTSVPDNTSTQIIPVSQVNNEPIISILDTDDEICLQTNETEIDHSVEFHDEQLKVHAIMETSLKTKSTTWNLKSRKIKDSCIFCTGNCQNILKVNDLKKKLCRQHSSKLFTCLCKNCNYVFTNRDYFIRHYRFHLNLDKQTYLCRTCFKILNCSRNLIKVDHKHQDLKKLYVCCSTFFSSMTDFVLHKLQKHRARICGTLAKVQESIAQTVPWNSVENDYATVDDPKQLFTCLEPNCDKVFNVLTHNRDHYRQHANIAKEYHLCGICLTKFNGERDYKLHSVHENHLIMCHECDSRFTSLHDLAKHKIQIHNSIVLCGDDSVPGCPVCLTYFQSNDEAQEHYAACYDFENEDNKKLVNTSLNSTKTINIHGSYVCKYCSLHYFSVVDYVTHLRRKHGQTIQEKNKGIKLCPVCDMNYTYSSFVSHIETCTRSMKIKSDNASTELFGCVYCKTVFSVFSAGQFRKHLLFCKSFVGYNHKGAHYFRCLNCDFKSLNHPECVAHANIYCIYFQLKMNYAMKDDERLKVEQRIQLLKENCDLTLQAVDIPPVVITLNHPANVLSDNSDIQWNRNSSMCCYSKTFRTLDLFNYLCNICDGKFFNEFAFRNHLDANGRKCRLNLSWYCTQCLIDFENENQYQAHLTVNLQYVPVPTAIPFNMCTLKTELLAEEATSDMGDDDDIQGVINENNLPYASDDFSSNNSVQLFEIDDDVSMEN